MKKIFTLFAATLFAAGMFAASYGILVNDKMFYAGTQNPTPGDPSFQEYMVLGLGLKAGDKFQLYDLDNKAGWAVNLDGASVTAVSRDGDHYACSSEGCYDFYIKLKYQSDQLYVGSGNCGTPQGTDITGGTNPGGQGGDNPGGQGQGGDNPGSTGLEESGEEHIFALMGSIGGDWNVTEIKEEYTFDERGRWSGSLAAHPQKPGAAYVIITDELGNQYKTKGWQGEDAKKVTLYWANGFEDSNVWQLPTGQTLYIIMRKCVYKGSIEVELVDQSTYNAYSIDWDSWNANAVENTTVRTNITKTIENGQVVIIKNGVRYNLLGAQLQ